jgi:hypothetical protein
MLKPNARAPRLPTTEAINTRIQGEAPPCGAAPPVRGKPTTAGAAVGLFVGVGTSVLVGPGTDVFAGPGTDVFAGPGTDVFAGPGTDVFAGPGTGVFVWVGVLVGRPVAVGVLVGRPVAVGVLVGRPVAVGVPVGRAAAQTTGPTVFESIVTAPVCARARPFKVAPVFRVMDVSARIFPINTVSVPRVAELTTLHHTLHGSPPVTVEPGDVMRIVDPDLKIQTPDPVRVRFPVSAKETGAQ